MLRPAPRLQGVSNHSRLVHIRLGQVLGELVESDEAMAPWIIVDFQELIGSGRVLLELYRRQARAIPF
jgi:hypothetical protein